MPSSNPNKPDAAHELGRVLTREAVISIGIHVATPLLFQAAAQARNPTNKSLFKVMGGALHLLDGIMMWRNAGA